VVCELADVALRGFAPFDSRGARDWCGSIVNVRSGAYSAGGLVGGFAFMGVCEFLSSEFIVGRRGWRNLVGSAVMEYVSGVRMFCLRGVFGL